MEDYSGLGLLIEIRLMEKGNKIDAIVKIYKDRELIVENKEKDLQSIEIGEDNLKKKN